jgi:hypothetical protein
MPVRHQILKRTIVSVVVGVASLQFANAENMTRDNEFPSVWFTLEAPACSASSYRRPIYRI